MSGTKRANSRRKTPKTVIVKAGRARMRISGLAFASGEGGSLPLMEMLAKRQRMSEMPAMTLVDQAKPILGTKFLRIKG